MTRVVEAMGWERSKKGYPIITDNGHKVTVFPARGGWKLRYVPNWLPPTDCFWGEFIYRSEWVAQQAGLKVLERMKLGDNPASANFEYKALGEDLPPGTVSHSLLGKEGYPRSVDRAGYFERLKKRREREAAAARREAKKAAAKNDDGD